MNHVFYRARSHISKQILTYISVIATVSTLSVIAQLLFFGRPSVTSPVLAVSLASTSTMLCYAYALGSSIEGKDRHKVRRGIRSYVILHLIPCAYLANWLLSLSLQVHVALWIIAFSVFFYTGARSWSALLQRYRSPMYLLFYRGHSGLLLMLPILSVIGSALFGIEWGDLAGRVLIFYCCVHFVLVGLSVRKIASDIKSSRNFS